MKSTDLCPYCKERPISPPLNACQDCFAEQVIVMETFTQIQQSHGTVTALAAKPVIEKAVKTGWKDEYLTEFHANLKERLAVQG